MSEFCANISKRNEHLAKLAIENGGEMIVPQKYLPKKLNGENKVFVEILSESQYEKRRKNTAKAILSEILGSQESVSQER